MDSFFFNLTDNRYKVTEVFKKNKAYLKRVDIANGIVFYKSNLLVKEQKIVLENLDRMIMIIVVQQGYLKISDHTTQYSTLVKEGEISIYCSSKQDITLTTGNEKESDIFILFVADFFLKRYLTGKMNEPIDYVYKKIQEEISLEHINTQPIDALSVYSIDKILNVLDADKMQSIRTEHRVMEFIIHRFSLLDILVEGVTSDELALASRAKEILLQDFREPPSLEMLAHLCATNTTKLKKVFKKVYELTIHRYIQKLRLKEANLLLGEQNLTIGEISKQIGYKHQGHFSKLFFSTYGVYPKELIKRLV
jgi:AraC-like DNA-binding protein